MVSIVRWSKRLQGWESHMGCRTAVVNAETPFRHTELARIPEEQLRSRWYPIFEERSWDCESCRKLTMGSMYQCRNCMRCLCQACFCAFPHAAVERATEAQEVTGSMEWTVTCRPCLAENPARLTGGRLLVMRRSSSCSFP